jgi:hypothetical protein
MNNKLIELVTKLKREISNQYAPNLLMLVEREGYSNFRLLISSDTLKSDLTTTGLLSRKLAKILSKEEFKILSGVSVVDQRSDFFIETRDYLENSGNPDELYNLELGGLKINRALIIVSPVDNSRKYVRQAELKQVLMRLIQLLERGYISKEELEQQLIERENFSTLNSKKQNLSSTLAKASQDKRTKTILKKDSINE